MREMEFKMERQNLVEVGQKVEVIERSCPANYHYIIKFIQYLKFGKEFSQWLIY